MRALLTVAGLLVLASPSPLYSQADGSETVAVSTDRFHGQPSYPVTRVIDGDTLDIEKDGKKVRIRLLGVDTPELAPELRQRFGKEARLFLKNLLQGERVFLEADPENTVDKYGRTLAYVYRAPDGLFVNLELIRQGYAQLFRKFPFKHKELFTREEKRAREKQKGLWDPDLSSDLASASGDQKELTVYVTRNGAFYHLPGCRHLGKSQIPMSLKDAKARHSACKACRPPS